MLGLSVTARYVIQQILKKIRSTTGKDVVLRPSEVTPFGKKCAGEAALC